MESKPNEKFEELLEAHRQALEAGEVEKAEELAMQCLVIAAEQANEEPSEDLRFKEVAHRHEDKAEWEKAEQAYRGALKLAEAEQNDGMIYKAHDELRCLFSLCGDEDRALEEARLALEAARKTDMPIIVGMALEGYGRCLLAISDAKRAHAAAHEIVQHTPNEKMYDLRRARGLIMRARCSVELNDIPSAESDLDVSWRMLAPQSGARMFAGVQSALASWWTVTAKIRSMQGDLPGAAHAWGKAVEFYRHVARAPQLEGPYKHNGVALALHRYSLALLAIGDIEAATQAAVQSRVLRRSLGLAPFDDKAG